MANTKVTSGVIKDDAVGADQLASNSVVTASINDNAITTAKIADDAILTAKISNSAITNAKMSANSVDSDQYVDASIDTAHIRDAQITSAKLDTNIAVSGTLTLGSHLIMGDNDRIKIGTGTDLEIYHDGTDTFIDDSSGAGNLYVLSNQFLVNNANGTQNMGRFADGGAVTLYYAGAAKLATASGGVTVTGTLTADDLEIDSGTLSVDASNNRVGIGTTSPQETLHLFNSAQTWNQYSNIRMSTESDSYAAEIGFHRGTSDDSDRGLFLSGDGTNKHVRILHGGNVGIGTTSPSAKLDVKSQLNMTNSGNVSLVGLKATTFGYSLLLVRNDIAL